MIDFFPKSRNESRALDIKYYFNGKACIHGHYSKRLTSTGQCCQCLSIRSQKQWQDPIIREKKKSQLQTYRAKTTSKEYQRLYRQRPEVKIRISEYNKKSYHKLSRSPEFRKKKSQGASEWVKNNREKHRAHLAARRHRLRSSGSFKGKEIMQLLEKQNMCCANPDCKAKLTLEQRNSFHIDHIVPVSKGGTNTIYNLQCLCPPCNLSKYNKMPEEWAKENWRLI